MFKAFLVDATKFTLWDDNSAKLSIANYALLYINSFFHYFLKYNLKNWKTYNICVLNVYVSRDPKSRLRIFTKQKIPSNRTVFHRWGRRTRGGGLEMLFSTQNVGKTNTCSHLELLLEIWCGRGSNALAPRATRSWPGRRTWGPAGGRGQFRSLSTRFWLE